MSSVAGSVGGASDDAGTEYKRAVVAFAVTHGLADTPLPLASMWDDTRRVVGVSTETTDPVDDVRIDFESGRTAYLQAKRSLKVGKPFSKAVAQWVEAAQAGIDPERQRLVIVSGSVSGSLKILGDLLDRSRSDFPADMTKKEKTAAAALNNLLTELTDAQRRAVWASAAIWELRVEEPHSTDSRTAISELRHLVADRSSSHASAAWTTLLSAAGRTARQRTGHVMAGWMKSLTGASIPLDPPSSSAAFTFLRRQQAIDAYFTRVNREGTHIDLRALGADLPPLPLDSSDADVHVRVSRRDPKPHGKLLWAFLRRNRAILTGLPGGGKSTALRHLAGQLTLDDTLPFPVYASLRGIDPRDPTRGIRQQIVEAATRDCAPAHRQEIAAEIDRRIDEDLPIAFLLDALDETYDDRHAVVTALASMVAEMPEGTSFLLATRHVAYAQAATLGWSELELLPPLNVISTVHAVLGLAAAHHGIAEEGREEWVDERVSWVRRALNNNRGLDETPLVPTFLAILASTREVNRLPQGRGDILVAVVEDFVLHRELVSRKAAHGHADEALRLGRRAFITEASVILESQGHATRADVVSAVADDLASEWGLSRGQAEVEAIKATRTLDEAGVFVFDPSSDRVVPRIAVLSEIGAAMFAVDTPKELSDWVSRRVEASQFDALVLVCSIDPRGLDFCETHLARDPDNTMLASAMAHVTLDLAPTQLRLVCAALIREILNGTGSGWRRLHLLLKLQVPVDLIEHLLSSMTRIQPEYQSLIRTEAHHVLGYSGPLVRGAEDDHATFGILTLPHHRGRTNETDRSLLREQQDLVQPHLHAAEGLVTADPRAAAILVERAMSSHSNRMTQDGLRNILERHGFKDEAAQVTAHITEQRSRWDFSEDWEADDTQPLAFFEAFEEWAPAPLTTRQSNTTDELSAFLQSAHIDAFASESLFPAEPDYVLALIRHAALALGFDLHVLSAQASLLVQRTAIFGITDPLVALHDELSDRSHPDWTRLDDPVDATSLFVRTLGGWLNPAAFAAYMLSGGPLSVIEDPLRESIRNLHDTPRQQRLAAAALAAASSGAIIDEWLADDNPVLREIVASLDELSPDLRRELLSDADRKVRVAALRKLIDEDPADLPAIRERVLSDAPVGWMCRGCAVTNRPEALSCVGEHCFQQAPQLRELALG